MMLTFILLCATTLTTLLAVSSGYAVSKSSGPAVFFLQDPSDGKCLAGDSYRRCGLDTLWYVTGKPGSYQVHHRLMDDEDDHDPVCVSKAQCHLDESDVQLMNCNHCGTKKWNIVGDVETGKTPTVLVLK